MKSTLYRGTICLIYLLAVSTTILPEAAAQEENAIRKPLPSRFFSENTMVLARINVGAANVDHLYESVSAIVPTNAVALAEQQISQGQSPSGNVMAMATMRAMADDPSLIEMQRKQNPGHPLNLVDLATAKLLDNDIDALFVVLMQSAAGASPDIYFMIDRDSRDSSVSNEQRRSVFTEVASMIGNEVREDGGWLVASTAPLPSAADDFGLDEEAFLEALRSNPLHDLMVAFVPAQEMREIARNEFNESLENSPPEEQAVAPLARNLIEVLDADWFYASADFGPEPAFRFSAHFADSTKPAEMAAALNQLIAALPQISPVERSANAEVQAVREANAAIQFQMMRLVRFDSSGPFMSCDLDNGQMQTLAEMSMQIQTEPVDNSPSAIDPTSGFGG